MIASSRELAVLDQASRMLEEAKSLEEIKTIRDKAEAARNYVKAAKLGLEIQNRAAEVKIRAERKAGLLLSLLSLRGGDRRSKRRRTTLKLEDLGISRDQSRRWQFVASVSDDEFSAYLAETTGQGREITSAGLLRVARRLQSKSNSPRRKTAQGVLSTARPHADVLAELGNHLQLLCDVLRPLYEEVEVELRKAEKRVVGRLLREMKELLDQLWTPVM
jgi:hypothetical protein